MKTVLILVVAVILSACAADEVSSTFITIPPPSPQQAENNYISDLYEWTAEQPYVTWVDVVSDRELLAFGYDTCTLADQLGVEGMLLAMVDALGDPKYAPDLAALVGAAVTNLCPEYIGTLNRVIGN